MFSTSSDILNLVLAVCLALLTFFLCWAIYYFVASVQKIHKLIKRVENGVIKAEGIIDLAKDKLKNSATYFMILGEIAKKAMEFVQAKRDKKASSKKK
ncbi:MAG: hypothetical protein NTY31_01710 [Candidatus Falkowbacteria bacterium]|nr:hypothetical protein [Candidatus Falkowbacteria bacterium]